MKLMRPVWTLSLFFIGLACITLFLFSEAERKNRAQILVRGELQILAAFLGATDLALTTEARYTRHLAVSDAVVVTMDHPGAIDHFPSSAVFQAVD